VLMTERYLAVGMFVYIETASTAKRDVLGGGGDVGEHLLQFVAAFKVCRMTVS
jgi:hypothetical protein